MLWRPSRSARPSPGFVAPCLPTLHGQAPAGSTWAHEVKHDGYRFICRREGDQVQVFTRRCHEWADRVPAIAAALRSLPVSSVTLDGEGVMCAADGITDFDRLRAALASRRAPEAFLYAFDILE